MLSKRAAWHAMCPNAGWLTKSSLKLSLNAKERAMAMGNRAMWAILWVIGIPLPVLIVLYYLTGGGCAQ